MRFIFFIIILFSNSILSQADLVNAKKPADIENKSLNELEALEYTDFEDNDILWSKVVYEYIPLNEKLNFPLLYPIEDGQTKIGRKSLWSIIKEYIKNANEDELQLFQTDNFSSEEKYDKETALGLISYIKSSPATIQLLMNEENISKEEATKRAKAPIFVNSAQVGAYKIKGIWFFDKKASELKYRLLGIVPVTAATAALEKGDVNKTESAEPFWIWYPSIREELNKHLVFNDRNNTNKISFDALLINRRFSSYIYKYDNVYGDREIKKYITKRDGEEEHQYNLRLIMESERIKKQILDFEVDMWGY